MNQASRSNSPQGRGSSHDREAKSRDRREDRKDSNDYNHNDSRSRSRSGQRNGNKVDNNSETLYVSNLTKRVDETKLRDKFSRFGRVVSVQVIEDPYTHECRGYAFVRFSTGNEASDALNDLNNTEFEGRPLKIEKAKRNKGHEPTPGKYLGHYKSSHRRSSSPHSRGRYERDLKRRERSRSRGRRSRSRSRDRYRNRSNSWSRGRGGRDRERRSSRDRHRSRSRDRSRERRR